MFDIDVLIQISVVCSSSEFPFVNYIGNDDG